MDRIIISELEVYYRVGITEAERAQPQRLLITLEMERDLRRAGAADDLRETIDYAEVSEFALHFGEGSEWELIESVSCVLADTILARYSPRRVTVEVKKFVIPQARYVAVRVTRP